jgi:hypothetical protein
VSKKSKPKSRWNAGNPRYGKDDSVANAKMREPAGWFRGARVVKR